MAFEDPVFVRYWSDTVARDAGQEAHVSAVFFDGYDKLYSDNVLAQSYKCPGFTENKTAQALRDKVAATAKFASSLNALNTTLILSSYNYLSASAWALRHVNNNSNNSVMAHSNLTDSTAAPGRPLHNLGSMSGVYEDEYVTMLNGTAWMHFYEVW